MTEEEYTAVTNLQQMRQANGLLRQCLPLGLPKPCAEEDLVDIIDQLGRLLDKMEQRVLAMVDEDQNPSGTRESDSESDKL